MKKIAKRFKFTFSSSGCSSVASHGGGGGNTGVGHNSAVGGGIGGPTVEVSSTSMNRPTHHKYKYKSPKQFELKQI